MHAAPIIKYKQLDSCTEHCQSVSLAVAKRTAEILAILVGKTASINLISVYSPACTFGIMQNDTEETSPFEHAEVMTHHLHFLQSLFNICRARFHSVLSVEWYEKLAYLIANSLHVDGFIHVYRVKI